MDSSSSRTSSGSRVSSAWRAPVRRVRMTALALCLTVLAFSASLQLAFAATTRYVSTSGSDSGDCSVNPCATIAYAISQSVAGDTIQIAAGTYTQFGITVDRDLTFSGAGASTTIVQAAASPNTATDRVFLVSSGVTATFGNLTIRNGKVSVLGGGIDNEGSTVNIANSTFSDNSADGGGGGIYNYSGTLNITDSTFSGNSAYGGGGIYNDGTVNVANSTFSGNPATRYGGGIASYGTLNVTNSTFSGNSAYVGGGIYNSGTLNVTNSTFSGNPADLGGGGIDNEGTLNVADSTFGGNSAQYDGGGIYNYGGTLNVTNSTFSGNPATRSGGGIYDYQGTVNVINSTFSGNSAQVGGGIYNEGTVNVTNSTFSGNPATHSGGGIYNNSTVNVTNSTFSGNSAQVGGGILNVGGTVNLQNTILTHTTSGSDCTNFSNGTIGGSNNLTDDTACGSAASFRLGAVTNFVKTLKNNGGPTKTHALRPGSNAINAVPSGQCTYVSSGTNPLFTDGATITTDQRGGIRPQQTFCDIGAYEHGGLKPANPRGLRATDLGNGQEQLKWKWTRDAFKYKVVVKDSGGNVVFSQRTRNTSVTPTLGPGGYTWFVIAINSLGSAKSSISSFTR